MNNFLSSGFARELGAKTFLKGQKIEILRSPGVVKRGNGVKSKSLDTVFRFDVLPRLSKF